MFANACLVLPVAFPIAAAATISLAAKAACAAIAAEGIETLTSWADWLNEEYITAQSHYWSAANADLIPACVVFPTNAYDVSAVVTALLNEPCVSFAVKSGGHNPNVGYSSVDGGVLISMSNISSTVLSEDQKIAEIGTGSRWLEAAQALEPYNLTVVSGRLGDVGVGGLTLGGGLSFLSTQYGLACDNVVNYEVVLADASIINANATSNPDLFWALKGGGNQFGIVTTFTMKTHPIGKVWGGLRFYSGEYAETILNATHDFNTNFKDPKAALIVTGDITIESLVELFAVFFFYDGETPPPGIFDTFNALPALIDNAKVQTYSELLNGDDNANLYGLRYLIRGTTLPNLPGTTGQSLYNGHYAQWKEYVMTQGVLNPGFIFSIAFQPMPYLIPAQSVAAGGNALGMTPESGDHMWMEYDISWLTSLADDTAHSMSMNITATVEEWAKTNFAGILPSHYKGPTDHAGLENAEYTAIFMNDAMYDQLPLQSYDNNGYARLTAIQRAVDPDGFFSTRTGGFKLGV
ncbi:hypothetical protein OIDMADRAFT_155290 [Oidiodendron maius Zn]|uniref:FAD-binding PCMH-type domain-containing protein n=1 Tax=Oidiodendron maius (strain Zn) TaxID=913774 RepID=A0A0C3D4S0_OIDMZ|nr:hypothetical protein OIDMADRAFT_155290 [Oidiodendron maius Zn]